jgi:hypothetical protein
MRRKAISVQRLYRGSVTESRLSPWRRATAFARMRPNFLIVGEMKCGTSSLYTWLLEHPAIGGYPYKEVLYFDLRYERSLSWYQGYFPLAHFGWRVRHELAMEPRIGEASPTYFFQPGVAERILRFDPKMKIIILMRDPVARAYSHYQHCRRRGFETLDFEAALDAEEGRLADETERLRCDPLYKSRPLLYYSYLARGRYAESLDRWQQLFAPEQVHTICSEDLFARPAAVLREVCHFLGLPSDDFAYLKPRGQRTYDQMNPATRKGLADYFKTSNVRLYEMLGRDLGWPTQGLKRDTVESRAAESS